MLRSFKSRLNLARLANPTPIYFVHDNIRHVLPYTQHNKVVAKPRWFGQRLGDILFNEFGYSSREAIFELIEQGKIVVNDKRVPRDYVLKEQDKYTYSVHRHEAPVTEGLRVLYQDEEYVIINKPGSIPVHPRGNFKYNSVLKILEKEHGIPHPKLGHRIDRPTSGLLFLGKSSDAAYALSEHFVRRAVSKFYLARVRGRFPSQGDDARVAHKLALSAEHAALAAVQETADEAEALRLAQLRHDALRANTPQTVFRCSSGARAGSMATQYVESRLGAPEPHAVFAVPRAQLTEDNIAVMKSLRQQRKEKRKALAKDWRERQMNGDLPEEAAYEEIIEPAPWPWAGAHASAHTTPGQPIVVDRPVVSDPTVVGETGEFRYNSFLTWTPELQEPLIKARAVIDEYRRKKTKEEIEALQATPPEQAQMTARARRVSSGITAGSTESRVQHMDFANLLMSFNVKSAVSVFSRVWYDPVSDSSLVLCEPLTGRTHQLRIHLQHLGFPIVNDEKYGGELRDSDIMPVTPPEVVARIRTHYDPNCADCHRGPNADAPVHYTNDTPVFSRGIWLHAFRYVFHQLPGTRRQLTFPPRYTSEMPEWAQMPATASPA